MSVQLIISVDDWLMEGKDPKKIEEQLKEDLILREYKNGDISIGQVAEHTGRTIEEAMDWVSSHDLSAYNLITPEMMETSRKNRNALIERLKNLRSG